MAHYANHFGRILISCTEPHQPTFLGVNSFRTQCVHVIDHSCAYCCLREIAAFVLLLQRIVGESPIPLHLRQLCHCNSMQEFLLALSPVRSIPCLVTLGLIFCLDGWDPSASSKNNRTPIHTALATLLCVDNIAKKNIYCTDLSHCMWPWQS